MIRKKHNPEILMETLEPRLLLSGTHYVVDSLEDVVADDGKITLREAIEAANTNSNVFDAVAGSSADVDIITFAEELLTNNTGTIKLHDSHISITSDLILRGPVENTLILDGVNLREDSMCIYIEGDESIDIEISNLSINNGPTAVHITGPSVTLENVDISRHISSGIVSNSNGVTKIINSSIYANISPSYDGSYGGGGGIRNYGNMLIVDSEINGNVSRKSGGGIFNFGNLEIRNSFIERNRSYWPTLTRIQEPYGGGIHNVGECVIIDCMLVGNISAQGGGIYSGSIVNIYKPETRCSIFNTTITGNRALAYHDGVHVGGSGGGVSATGTIEIVGSVITANHAEVGGGVYVNNIYNVQPRLSYNIINSTISGNTASVYGGGLANHGFGEEESPYEAIYVQLTNTIISDNTDSSLWFEDVFGLVETQNSIISANPLFIRTPSDGGDGWGDDLATPINESLNDDYGDLRLLPQSIAINQGDYSSLPVDTADIDQDGDTQELLPLDISGVNRNIGGQVDIGAYEYVLPGDFNYDDVVNLNDLALLATNFGKSKSELPGLHFRDGDSNSDGVINLVDLAELATYFGQSGPSGGPQSGAGASPDMLSEAILLNGEPSTHQTEQLNWNHIGSLLDEDRDSFSTI